MSIIDAVLMMIGVLIMIAAIGIILGELLAVTIPMAVATSLILYSIVEYEDMINALPN